MRKIFTLLFIAFVSLAHAQINVQWESRYNGTGGATNEQIADMLVDAAGNVYVTGTAYSGVAQGFNMVTIKYNSSGTQQWAVSFNGSGNGLDEGRAIALDASGNVCVTGYAFRGGSNYDYTTVKYDNNGNLLWQQYYDAGASLFDDARDITVDASGNIFVTGTGQATSTNANFRTLKYNSTGTLVWARDFTSSGSNVDNGLLVEVDNAGDVYVAGAAFNTGQDLNIRVLKYDTNGNLIWQPQYNSPLNSYDYPKAMGFDASGNLFVTGYSYNGAASDDDIVTLKISPAGTILSNVTFNGTANGSDQARSLAIDASNNVYVVGKIKNSGTNEDFGVIKYDNNLSIIWDDSYNGGGGNYDEAADIAIDNFGNVYVTGYSYLGVSNNDYLTVKYAPMDGSHIWTTRFNGTANNSDQAKKISVDAAGNVYVSGDSRGSGTNSDYSTIKYCQLTTDAGADQQICVGDQVQLNATGGSVSVSWTPAAGLSCTTCANPVATPSASTCYFVTTTDGNNCSDADTLCIVVKPLPGATITASGPTSFCIGDSVTLTASGFAAYNWSNGDTDSVTTVYTAGSYSVTVTDAMGCNNSTSQSVTVFSLPTVDAGTATPYCVGDSVQLNASGAVTYNWSSDPELSDTTIANPYASPLVSSWFYVTGMDANGCVNSDSVEVIVHQLPPTPTVTYISSNFNIVTNNSSGNQWYQDGNPVSGATGQTFVATQDGNYWVVYTDTNGCVSMNSDTISVIGTYIDESQIGIALHLFPNPTSGSLNLEMESDNSSAMRLEVLDAVGRVTISESISVIPGKTFHVLDLSMLNNGIYLIRI